MATRRGRRVGRGFGRTFAVGALCTALAIGTSLYGTTTAGAADGFSNGRANAIAQVQRVAPGVGSLQLGITSGRSIADMTNNLAQAQAQTLDLGLIGTSLTAEQCSGDAASIKNSDLPAPTTVDNRHGDASASHDDYPVPGGLVPSDVLGGGREQVSATTAPSADASVSAVTGAVGPLAQVSAGHSEATTKIIDAKAREAEAKVSLDLDIAGVVQLHNLQWRALHRTGADPDAEGTFSAEAASVGAVPFPTDQAGPLQDAINSALAPSGVTVVLPRVEHITKPNDVIRVTPLTITLKDSPIGKAALGPGLNLTRQEREQLFVTLVKADCRAAAALLVGDITLDVASGTGFLIMEIGGVEASSSDLTLGNPFGDFVPLQNANVPLPLGETFANGAPVAGPVGAPPTAAPGTVTTDLGPLAAVCESLHPTREPLCSHGMGAPIGVAGVLVTGGIALLDWRRQRRLLAPPPADLAV
jgi:hypothetical protein